MIYYLVQGEAYQYPDRMAEMADSGAEVIFLTWDKQIDGALFLPDSSMMQGRDFLIQHVLKNNYTFDYLVLMDGDAKPIKGSWQDFNNFLLAKRPQICLPLMQCTMNLLYRLIKKSRLPLPIPLWQRALLVDMQTLAFRKDIINAVGDIMHPTIFDHISWCFNCDIHLSILRNIVPHNVIQFNGLELSNNCSNEYPNNHDYKFIINYIKKIGLDSLLPLFEAKPHTSKTSTRIRQFLILCIELFYLIPFPIKEFDVAKRAEYVKQCVQKINQSTEEITKNKKSCKSI